MGTQTQKDTKKRNKLGLTPTQKKVYDVIVKFIESNKYSPSYEELKQVLGYKSKSPVHGLIHQLKRRNWIKSQKGASRSIVIL
jgi:repressor LexA